MINIDIITAFKNNFILNKDFFIYKKAIQNKIINLKIQDLRQYSKKNKIDHKIYGLEYGMLYQFDPIDNILNKIYNKNKLLIYPHPSGKKLNNNLIYHIVDSKKDLIFLCDRYEGIDCRIIKKYNPLTISIGNYIISNGELASTIILDTILRYLILNKQTLHNESFEKNNNYLLDHLNYTKPRITNNQDKVPKVLLSGHHKNIKDYLWERKILNTLLFNMENLDITKLKPLKNNQKKIIIKKIIKLLQLLSDII